MGPEVIEVEFSRQKQRAYFHMNVYGYAENRQDYYKEVLKLLGVNTAEFIDLSSDANKIRVNALPSPLDTAYHNIELVNSLIFKEYPYS